MSTSTAERAVIDREQLINVAVDLIDRDSTQPRTIFEQGELEELAADILARGLRYHLLVFSVGGRYRLIGGDRRLQAIIAADLKVVTCRVLPVPPDEGTIHAEQLLDDLHSVSLSAMEKARSFSHLMEIWGIKIDELAKRLRIRKGRIARSLNLLRLPDELQEAVGAKDLPVQLAHEVARLAKTEDMSRAWELLNAESGLTFHQARAIVHRVKREAAGGKKKRRQRKSGVQPVANVSIRKGTRLLLNSNTKLDDREIVACAAEGMNSLAQDWVSGRLPNYEVDFGTAELSDLLLALQSTDFLQAHAGAELDTLCLAALALFEPCLQSALNGHDPAARREAMEFMQTLKPRTRRVIAPLGKPS